MRVLLVEDALRLRHYIAKGLRDAGWAVDAADNGEDGLWIADSDDYDVIVLDLMLPKIDGVFVLRRLRECERRSVRIGWAPEQAHAALVCFPSLGLRWKCFAESTCPLAIFCSIEALGIFPRRS